MDEEINPAKDFLFKYINQNEKKFSKLFAQTKMAEVINDILKNCFDKISLMKSNDENLRILATGILHYMLTNAMITSQRKIEYKGTRIDIVIPDLKTLEKDPKKTLIIYISKTSDKNIIKKEIKKLEKIQPEKQNIWIVSNQNLKGYKNYSVQKNNSSFSNIIFDIGQFVNIQGYDKFKILRI